MKSNTRPRKLFTDGWDSLWHFVFGFLSVYNTVLALIFILYQLYDYTDKNVFIDITEFLIGFYLAFIVFLLYREYKFYYFKPLYLAETTPIIIQP